MKSRPKTRLFCQFCSQSLLLPHHLVSHLLPTQPSIAPHAPLDGFGLAVLRPMSSATHHCPAVSPTRCFTALLMTARPPHGHVTAATTSAAGWLPAGASVSGLSSRLSGGSAGSPIRCATVDRSAASRPRDCGLPPHELAPGSVMIYPVAKKELVSRNIAPLPRLLLPLLRDLVLAREGEKEDFSFHQLPTLVFFSSSRLTKRVQTQVQAAKN